MPKSELSNENLTELSDENLTETFSNSYMSCARAKFHTLQYSITPLITVEIRF